MSAPELAWARPPWSLLWESHPASSSRPRGTTNLCPTQLLRTGGVSLEELSLATRSKTAACLRVDMLTFNPLYFRELPFHVEYT